MKEPKVASAPVDAERVVHELLDALETLRKKTGTVSDLGESEPEQIPALEGADSSESSSFDAQSRDRKSVV